MAYNGPMSKWVPLDFETLEQARQAQSNMNDAFPVGWALYNRQTMEQLI